MKIISTISAGLNGLMASYIHEDETRNRKVYWFLIKNEFNEPSEIVIKKITTRSLFERNSREEEVFATEEKEREYAGAIMDALCDDSLE